MGNDISIYKGNDVTLTLNLTDSDGNALDVSGYDFFLTAKESISDTDENAKIKVDQSVAADDSDAQGGTVTITIPKEDTENLDAKKYVYDIQWKDTSGDVRTVIVDDIILHDKVTDRTSVS